MKQHKLTRKLLLRATAIWILMTLIEIVLDSFGKIPSVFRRDIELIAGWIVLLIGWSVYLLDLFRKYRQNGQ